MPRSVEAIRRRWKPRPVRVLFVGESPPESGDFFYKLSAPSALLGYTQEAFSTVFEDVPDDPRQFLRIFRARGCYLEDLCHTPIDKIRSRAKKERLRERGIKLLGNRIRSLRPEAVMGIMKGISRHVTIASCYGRVDPELVWSIPFAGQHHQPDYVRELRKILRRLIKLGILT